MVKNIQWLKTVKVGVLLYAFYNWSSTLWNHLPLDPQSHCTHLQNQLDHICLH